MKALTFTVYGKPVAKGRPRMTKSGHVYTPQTTREHEERIRNAAMSEMGRSKILPWTEKQPLKVIIECFFALPKSATKKQRIDVLEHRKFPSSMMIHRQHHKSSDISQNHSSTLSCHAPLLMIKKPAQFPAPAHILCSYSLL